MSLLVPGALAWIAAASVVIAIYLLRRQERDMPVSALFLWERVQPDALSRIARWLPHADTLLLMQLLVVLLMALILSAPVTSRTRPAGATAVLVDTSLALAPRGRLEEAKERARALVQDAAGPWVLIGWADPPQLLVRPTDREAEILAGINRLAYNLSDRPPLSQALALVPPGWERVVVITGAPPEDAQVEVARLSAADNLSIEAFAVRSQPDGSRHEALVAVRNDTQRYRDAVVTVRDVVGGRSFEQTRLLEPGAADTFVFPLWGFVGPAYVAELSPSDDFPYDNTRYSVVDLPPALRVRWKGEEDRYLWGALAAAASVERTDDPPWDLTVVVRTELEEPPSGPCILVEAGLPEAPRGALTSAGTWRAKDDPLLAHVDTTPWSANALYDLSFPEGADVALRSGDIPALVRWLSAYGPRVALTIQLARSNLPLSLGFPILLRNALAWLLPGPSGTTVTVGQAVRLPPNTTVHTRDGPVSSVWVPDEPGLFTLHQEERERYAAANLPQVSLNAPPTAVTSHRHDPGQHDAPIWPWLSAVVLVLMGAEWLLARRRGA